MCITSHSFSRFYALALASYTLHASYSFYCFFLSVCLLIFLIVFVRCVYILCISLYHVIFTHPTRIAMQAGHVIQTFVVFVFSVFKIRCFKCKNIVVVRMIKMNISTIYAGKPVISLYGITGNKTQDWWISFKNRVYQVPYTEKLPQNAHTGIKKNFPVEHYDRETGLPFQTFCCSRKFCS